VSFKPRHRATADRLIAAASSQTVLDMITDGEAGDLAAAVVRTALVERADQVGQYGVRISNARITGTLDLSGCRISFPIQFRDCEFVEPLLIEGSDLDLLAVVGTPVNGEDGLTSSVPGILGNGLRVRRDLVLSHTLITGAHETTSSVGRTATVWLTESDIGGRIIAVGAVIDAAGDRAIQADRCRVTGDIRLIQGFRANGEIRFIGARLGGSLDLAGCQLKSPKGRALDLAEATVGGSLFITDTPRHAPTIEGRLEMGRASINGRILIRRAMLKAPPAGEGRHLYNAKDPAERLAIVAQGVGIRGDLSLEEKSCVVGAMTFAGATIDGGLLMDGAEICNSQDLALDLTHARIGSKVSARGAKVQGTVDLDGAEVAGPLDFEGAALTWPDFRYCLTAVRTVVHGDVRLADAEIGGPYSGGAPRESGGVSFRGADLHGIFDAERAKVNSPGDTAINLHQARVAGNVRLCAGFRAVGFVALNRAVIDGRLRCDGGTFEWRPREQGDSRPGEQNDRAVAFEAISATIRGGVGLGWTIDGAVDFTDAHTSYLADRSRQDWPSQRSYLTGFTYERYAPLTMQGSGEWHWKSRAAWLSRSDPAARGQPGDPGPWEQAARTLKSHGDAAGSEKLLMEYLRTKRKRRAGRFHSRFVRGLDRVFNDWFRGYGYRPLRALLPLALLIIVVTATLLPDSESQLMRTADPAGVVYTPRGQLSMIESGQSPVETCGKGKVRCFNPLLYAIDTVVPVVDLKQRTVWSPSVDAGGKPMLYWLNAATLAGWAISSLLVVGLARAGSRSLD
jgi:hypothetical protein